MCVCLLLSVCDGSDILFPQLLADHVVFLHSDSTSERHQLLAACTAAQFQPQINVKLEVLIFPVWTEGGQTADCIWVSAVVVGQGDFTSPSQWWCETSQSGPAQWMEGGGGTGTQVTTATTNTTVRPTRHCRAASYWLASPPAEWWKQPVWNDLNWWLAGVYTLLHSQARMKILSGGGLPSLSAPTVCSDAISGLTWVLSLLSLSIKWKLEITTTSLGMLTW